MSKSEDKFSIKTTALRTFVGCTAMVASNDSLLVWFINVYKQCTDVDLCESCISQHETNTLALTQCRGYHFFRVDDTGLRTNQSLKEKGEVGFDA